MKGQRLSTRFWNASVNSDSAWTVIDETSTTPTCGGALSIVARLRLGRIENCDQLMHLRQLPASAEWRRSCIPPNTAVVVIHDRSLRRWQPKQISGANPSPGIPQDQPRRLRISVLSKRSCNTPVSLVRCKRPPPKVRSLPLPLEPT